MTTERSIWIPYHEGTGDRSEETFTSLNDAEAWILDNSEFPEHWAVEEKPA